MNEVSNLTQEEIKKSIKDPMEKHRAGNIYKTSENFFYIKWNTFYFFSLDWKFEFKRNI